MRTWIGRYILLQGDALLGLLVKRMPHALWPWKDSYSMEDSDQEDLQENQVQGCANLPQLL